MKWLVTVNWDNIFSTQDGSTIWNKFFQALKEALDFADIPSKSVKKQQRPLGYTRQAVLD